MLPGHITFLYTFILLGQSKFGGLKEDMKSVSTQLLNTEKTLMDSFSNYKHLLSETFSIISRGILLTTGYKHVTG